MKSGLIKSKTSTLFHLPIIYGSTALVDHGRFFCILSVRRTGAQPIRTPLHTHTTPTQNKCTHTYIHAWLGFEPTSPVRDQVKTYHPILTFNHAAVLISLNFAKWLPTRCIRDHGSLITTDPWYDCPRINFSMGCSRNKCHLYPSPIFHGIYSCVVSLVACKFSTILRDRSVVTSFCNLAVVR
jgi:hypothetical protein